MTNPTGRLRFRKPKERLRVANRRQGLRLDDKVLVKGSNKNKHEALLESLKKIESRAGGEDHEEDMFGMENSSDESIGELVLPKKKGRIDGNPQMSKKRYGMKKKLISNRPGRHGRNDGSMDPRSTTNEWKRMAPTSIPREESSSPRAVQKLTPPDISEESSLESFSDDDDFSMPSDSDDNIDLSFSGSDDDSMSIPLDDSMSIISGSSGGGGRNNKKKKGGGSGGASSATSAVSKQAEEIEKNDLLRRFHILRQRGVKLSKNFTPKSNLKEMQMEMGRIEYEKQSKRSVQFNRRLALIGSAGIARVTDQYGPKVLKGRWHGFDKYVLNSISDYDSAFERMSEHYGGVVSTLTGGNPLWEIMVLFAWQFVMYGFFSDGADSARAEDNLSSEDIRSRYPHLVNDAVEKELAVRKQNEDIELRRRQYEVRNYTQQTSQPPPPTVQVHAPSQPTQYFDPVNNARVPVAQPHHQQQTIGSANGRYAQGQPTAPLPQLRPSPITPPPVDIMDVYEEPVHLNAENPNVLSNPTLDHHVPTSDASIYASQQYGRQRAPNGPLVAPSPYPAQAANIVNAMNQINQENKDAFRFQEMYDALPSIETDAPIQSHYTQPEHIQYEEPVLVDHSYDSDEGDNLDMPTVTRDATELPVPQNKRDKPPASRTPFGKHPPANSIPAPTPEMVQANKNARDKLVININ